MQDFPVTMASPIRFRDPLPEACDLVVIGGGIIGASTAFFAAKAGLRVVLCEKGRVAGEQSSRNWGWIRQQGRDLGELPIVMEALRHWKAFGAQLGDDTLGLRWTGILKPARTQAQMARFETWTSLARPYGVDTRLLSRSEVTAMVPEARVNYIGGLLTPSDGRAEPQWASPMIAHLAHQAGAVIREDCAVRALDVTAGRVLGVETSEGFIRASRVVLAGGAWSRLLLGLHGVSIPQLSVLASVAATEPVGAPWVGGFSEADYAFRTRADGGLTIAPNTEHDFHIGRDAFASFWPYMPTLRQDFRSTTFRPWAPKGFPDAWGTARKWKAASPFEAMPLLAPRPNMASLQRAMQAIARVFPALEGLQIRHAWAGMIDTMPDVVPIVDEVPQLSGLILATGMAGHGFGIGPGFGRILADMVQGKPAGHDMSRFRFKRFSDGSRLDFGAAL